MIRLREKLSTRKSAVAAACLCALFAVRGEAQSIRGRVVDAASHSPVANAVAELRDAAGTKIASAVTSASGGFIVLAPGPGAYSVRVIAIGYTPRIPLPLHVPADSTLGDLAIEKAVFQLKELVAIGQPLSCGKKKILADDLFGRLLNSARTALEVMSATIDKHQVTFSALTVGTRVDAGIFARPDSVTQKLSRWPLESVQAAGEGDRSFGVIGSGKNSDGGKSIGGTQLSTFFGPDAQVLFSDWFLERHCFQLQKVKAGADMLRISFTPSRKFPEVDISGELDLDAHFFSLRRIAFLGENLPRYIDKKSAGGEVRFSALTSGMWLPSSWTIWAPVQGTSQCLWRTVGLVEQRGAIVSVTMPDPAGGEPMLIHFPGELIPRQTKFDHESCLARPSPMQPLESGR